MSGPEMVFTPDGDYNGFGYYDYDGNLIPMDQWVELWATTDRRVGFDQIGDLVVSTVYLGFPISYPIGGAPPIFETAVIPLVGPEAGRAQVVERHPNQTVARERHAATVDQLRQDPDAQLGEVVDLDLEEYSHDGERLTEERAEIIAAEMIEQGRATAERRQPCRCTRQCGEDCPGDDRETDHCSGCGHRRAG